MDKDLGIITYAVTLIIKAAIMAAQFSARVRILSLTRIPSFGYIISRGFFDGADMSIQPKNIKPSAGPEVFVTPYIMSEDVPIVICTRSPLLFPWLFAWPALKLPTIGQ